MGHPYRGCAQKHPRSHLTFRSTAATSAPHPRKISSFPREEISKKGKLAFFCCSGSEDLQHNGKDATECLQRLWAAHTNTDEN